MEQSILRYIVKTKSQPTKWLYQPTRGGAYTLTEEFKQAKVWRKKPSTKILQQGKQTDAFKGINTENLEVEVWCYSLIETETIKFK